MTFRAFSGLLNRFRHWRFRRRSKPAAVIASAPTRGSRAYCALVAQVAEPKLQFVTRQQMPHGEIERQLNQMGGNVD